MPHEEKGTREDLIRYRIETAEKEVRSAEILMEHADFKGANNRAYYAIFHAIRAILAKEGTDFKRHKDVLAYFNKEYVKPEIFSRELGRRIAEAEEIRHASDYDDFYLSSRDESEETIATAKDIIAEVKKYIVQS